MYHNSLHLTRGGSFDGGKSSVVPPGPPAFPQNAGSVRETGIIDKLMTSFGFITCCERNESIFFHFSQCSGSEDPTDLKPGDEVEFEVGTDARTGKLIARRVVRLPSGTVSFESVGEERLLGKVECEPLITRAMDAPKLKGSTKGTSDLGMGRIIYERNGECFFVPYAFTDVNDDREIHRGDEVSFYMARNKRTTALRARLVRLVQSAKVEKIQGIVKTLKDSFGFIERADEAKDIFFHKSELTPGCEEEICVGAYVEFVVQDRQGKEVATQLKVLPPGSVQFDDIGSDTLEGVVKKPLIRSFTHGHAKEIEPIPGQIIYISDGNIAQTLPYTEQDQLGTYTMLSGDTVTFNLAVRRRNGAQRATNVRVLKMIEKNMNRSNLREKGIVATLRDGFGFIRCVSRVDKLFFHFSEVIDIEHPLAQHDEVEFSVGKDHTQERLHATRITICDPGTVQFEQVSDEVYQGRVELELQTECSRNPPQPFKIQDTSDYGIIRFHVGDGAGEEEITFYWSPEPLRFGDQVQFQVACRCYDELCYATNIKVVQWAKDFRFQGFIATLKDSYGFIEPEEHDCEMFFPFSSCNKFCDPQELEIMDEVEYCVVKKNGKMSADEIKKLPQGTIPKEEVQPGNYEGVVIKVMKSTENPLDYEGIIKCTNLEEGVTPNGGAVPQELPYSFTSIEDHRATLQLGDAVEFQVGISPHSKTQRAVNVRPKFAFIRGIVDSIKDQYGFIAYTKDGQTENVFFHMNSLANGCAFTDLKPGDEVEFLTTFNQKTQRASAAHVKKLSASVRPDRLVRKNLSGSNSTANMCVLRQPKGPDDVGCGFAPRSSSAGDS